jgi:tripartite-type tricarboxylate transporter receptor subunit TctC
MLARMLAKRLQEELAQPVIVENKPGAGSIVGVDFVAKAGPDGYTLLFATGAALAINPFLNLKLPSLVSG